MPTMTEVRHPVGSRRIGYAGGALVNATLLYLVNGRPGWTAVPFLTSDMARVLTIINVSIVAGVTVNLVRIAYDPRWSVALGDVVATMIGAVALLRIWQVFPFQFDAGAVDWPLIVRVVLAFALVGSAFGIVAGLVSMVRAVGAEMGTAVRVPRADAEARHRKG
ncbi:hypothetical protein [Jidongwangia harbinensis]|uniref:hypothetical protein n=1 Tax=Jidongwangia harbinensis TaxID=2878561 RepID=UPI001CDA09C4|nr:hypothetical protein [Jidongwangia harbinensis]MCA2219291.1 hypothetical protein [Jidongwangia harbinensis]